MIARDSEPVRKHRDGHCHESVMWYVHHLPESLKEVITDKASLPLLSEIRHDLSLVKLHTVRVQRAYEEKVTCTTLLNNTPAEDSHYGNIAEYAAGTSGQTSEWYITEVGSQLFTNSGIGTYQYCTVRLRHPVGNKDLWSLHLPPFWRATAHTCRGTWCKWMVALPFAHRLHVATHVPRFLSVGVFFHGLF